MMVSRTEGTLLVGRYFHAYGEVAPETRRRSREGQSQTPGGKTMRVMIKFALPVESSNAAIRTGKLEKVFHQIVEDLKPEAAYFSPQGESAAAFSSWRCKIRRR
jgi:hypothetical protein